MLAKRARDFLKTDAVGIDDIGENLYDLVREEILDEVGNVGDPIDLQTDRVESIRSHLRAAECRSVVRS